MSSKLKGRKKKSSLFQQQTDEILKCAASPLYFITTYIKIYDVQAKVWIPFDLWPEQIEALELLHENQMTVALKARQLVLTGLALAYGVWVGLFRPIAAILLFSKRDDEAVYLLGIERLRGMYNELPEWLRARELTGDSAHLFALSNGSSFRAFPTSAGDSYTASYVIVDEADLIPDFNALMRSVKPTIEAGGKLFLISRVDKSKPQSEFKKIYRAAKQRLNDYAYIFLAWFVRPERTQAWYDSVAAEILTRTGSLDEMHEQYPATDIEALAPRSLDKRIAPFWLMQCYAEMGGIEVEGAPAIPQLIIYRAPIRGRKYVGGLDPAEGNPTSDDSAMTFLDKATAEEVAMLTGKFEPSVMAFYADQIGRFFNNADLMVERNNHGHAVLLWLRDNSKLKRLCGHDDRECWHSTSKGKSLLYDTGAEAFKERETLIHSFATYIQLTSIEGATLRAPEGEMDDLSDSYVLGLVGIYFLKPKVAVKVGVRGLYPNQR